MSGAIASVRPLTLDEVRERYPTIRQSRLVAYDDCPLASWFSERYASGVTTAPQARGTILHRVFSACLREAQRCDSEFVPADVALAILEEKLRQRDVPPSERVRVPLRELRTMEWVVVKFARDNSFTIRNLVAVERQLEATVSYRTEHGELIERTITGRPDAMISRPPDEVVLVDWKSGFAVGPKRDEDADDPGVSYHGIPQLAIYSFLTMANYASVQAVALREFNVYRSQARAARVVRAEMPRLERQLSQLVENYDRSLMAGPPVKLTLDALNEQGAWMPSPGRHCGYCPKARLCPIDGDVRGDGGITTPEKAERAAAERQVARSVDKRLTNVLKVWVENNGPVPVKYSKGRLVLGHRPIANGKTRFEEYTPEGADRPPTREVYDANSKLAEAMRASVAEARRERNGG